MSANKNPSESVSVEVRGLRKSFGKLEVLKDVNFKVNPGEIFVIMGPSGSGKSVMLREIIGLDSPDAGEILIQGESVQSPGIRDKYRMAMVFQSAALLTSLSVGENVALFLTEHTNKPQKEVDQIVAQKLEAVGLKDVQNRSPGELSGGMQKRVAIARALVMDPQLFLFDEPTAELDPPMAVTIGEEILKLKQNTHATSIIVTHDRSLAFSLADRVAMFINGQILFIGSPEEVQRQADPRIQEFINPKPPSVKPS
jgi:phospholipid/cholesterol/gamma-HCH transport system ATP-binding protein